MLKLGKRYWRVSAAGLVFLLVFLAALPAVAERFRVASWNLENLFDLSHDKTEYPGYIPGGPLGWNEEMLDIKLDNVSRVIADLSPRVIGLQEVESEKALERLQKRLRKKGLELQHSVIADKKPSTVKCALLSSYPVISYEEISVPGGKNRSILRADLDVSGNRLVVFVNHWKSKSGPESRRIAFARALAAAVADLQADTDYIILGDFNSNHDEFKTIQDRPSLNDTSGITGINHVLNTLEKKELVREKDLIKKPEKQLHYNLWLEVEKHRRWSTLFFSRPGSPDSILLPSALYDKKGVSYVDNTFDRFDPGYVYDGENILRWQREKKGKGRHLAEGYSDHLPVYACFTDNGFEFLEDRLICHDMRRDGSIRDLYDAKTGAVSIEIKDCAVIYKHGENAVLKQKNGRAVYVYKAAGDLEKDGVYDISVSRLKRYYGNLEITGIESAEKTGEVNDPEDYFVKDPDADLSGPSMENEVAAGYRGIYRDERFYYGKGNRIRLYFKDKSLAPEPGSRILVRRARIGYHKTPELVIEKPEQISTISRGDF
ncbi:MAG: endonuclease/exonuclease/phosphatase family protein [Desulfosalsimonas sp.]